MVWGGFARLVPPPSSSTSAASSIVTVVLRRVAAAILTLVALGSGTAGADVNDPANQGPSRAITFPVIGPVQYSDTYGAPRSGDRTHAGQDLMGSKMQELVAASDGTVTYLTIPEAPYGYMLTITDDEGWSYHYIHINNDTPGTDDGQASPEHVFAPGIERGARVEAGQLVAYMGDSGNAEGTAPHVHFEMEDPSGLNVNPYRALQEATVLTSAKQAEPSPFARLAGPDRVATSIAASKAGWSKATAAVIASGSEYSEGLPASVLAAEVGGPLLLATTTSLPRITVDELERLGVETVHVVGSVATGVDSQLRNLGYEVVRVGSSGDRVATSVSIARAVGAADKTVVLVNMDRFADGISAAGLAAGRGWPVLLTTASTIPQRTVDTWRALGAERVILVGGPVVIGDNIETFVAKEATVDRLAGMDRYATSVEVVEEALANGRTLATVHAATGSAFPDALAVGPLAARREAITLLVDGAGTYADEASRSFLSSNRSDVGELVILGGSAAVGSIADRALQDALGL